MNDVEKESSEALAIEMAADDRHLTVLARQPRRYEFDAPPGAISMASVLKDFSRERERMCASMLPVECIKPKKMKKCS